MRGIAAQVLEKGGMAGKLEKIIKNGTFTAFFAEKWAFSIDFVQKSAFCREIRVDFGCFGG